MYLGDYLAVGEEIAPFTFACESVSTGTPFTAVVDGDKRHLFLDRSFPSEHPSACPFLRPRGDHVLCTIHGTSPVQCKFYRCVVMQIFDGKGALVGRVTGTLALHSDDRALRDVWDAALARVEEGSPDVEECLGGILEAHGYRVE